MPKLEAQARGSIGAGRDVSDEHLPMGHSLQVDEARARCWADVDLDALDENYLSARAMLSGGSRLIPVLKGNAYGIGACAAAKSLCEKGADIFAVATVSEALEILQGQTARVLVMGAPGDALLPAAIRAGMELTVYSLDEAHKISAAARGEGRAARVHFKLDTGMHRLGFDPDEAARAILEAARLPLIEPVGLFTHLALHTKEADALQFEGFDRVNLELRGAGLRLAAHVLDSIGLVRYPGRQYDAVRVGAWLYGVCPARYPFPERDKAVVSLKARITQLRSVEKGELIGYDDDHPLERSALVATISCGFADGYPRFIDKGEVEVLGARARVLGRVCMDQMMADVTGVPGVRTGDEVTLLGGGISLDEYAAWGELNRNEALCRVSRRVPRVYVRAGRVVDIEHSMKR